MRSGIVITPKRYFFVWKHVVPAIKRDKKLSYLQIKCASNVPMLYGTDGFFFFFSFSFGVTVNAEAGMTIHSQS